MWYVYFGGILFVLACIVVFSTIIWLCQLKCKQYWDARRAAENQPLLSEAVVYDRCIPSGAALYSPEDMTPSQSPYPPETRSPSPTSEPSQLLDPEITSDPSLILDPSPPKDPPQQQSDPSPPSDRLRSPTRRSSVLLTGTIT